MPATPPPTRRPLVALLPRGNVRELLSAADAYSFPSRAEAFPVALIEAMVCGLPPVAADASGVREILGAQLRELLIRRPEVI